MFYNYIAKTTESEAAVLFNVLFKSLTLSRHLPQVFSPAWSNNECHVYFRTLSSTCWMRRHGLGCRGWLAPVAARGSSLNRQQEGNGVGGQIRWTEVIVVDLVSAKITAILWVRDWLW